jgi:hypothetical protein
VQNALLAVIVGASLVCLTALAMFTPHRRGHAVLLQLGLGTLVGVLAAGIVLILRVDFVPDDTEVLLASFLVVVVSASVIFALLHRRR